MSVEIFGMRKGRHKKYFWHAGNLSIENLKKGAAKRNATADQHEIEIGNNDPAASIASRHR